MTTPLPPIELRLPRRSEGEEMLAGKLYNAADPQLESQRHHASALCERFNATPRDDVKTRNAAR